MKMNLLAKPLFIILLVLGLAAGCASTPDMVADQATAEQAIADAKASNAEAEKIGAEWRDTGSMIKDAEAALAAGDYAKAIELANDAQRQADNAIAQAQAEDARLRGDGTLTDASEDMSSSVNAAGSVSQYEVMGGDNLWNISGKDEVYSNAYQWPLIYKANRDKIKDADLIYPGQVFDIDRDASSSDIDAAITHAKTRGAWSVGTVEATDEAYLAQ
ncbi:MAG: LysM peptidoglycan-binding domain-containing protein [Gammaproteobacteria bacterium]|nr:LysM peptidoglycan-binding domain-containing protein [Gammaproteobacteria bacterium]